jgi:hypothetical protein
MRATVVSKLSAEGGSVARTARPERRHRVVGPPSTPTGAGEPGGFVHAAFFAGAGGGVIQIATSPVGTDAWTVSPTQVQFGAGPVPHAQLILHGTTGWLIEVDRTVIGGARLVDGTWRDWQPPCLDANGPATLAAATDRALVAACDVGVWSTPTGVHLYASVSTCRVTAYNYLEEARAWPGDGANGHMDSP